MTTFLLIRHAAHVLGGQTIAGRTPGVHLSEAGARQAERLADRVSRLPVQALYCSPIDRARQTAQPLAERLGLAVHVLEPLSEVDFGDWSGQRLDDLRPQERWKQWNTFRSGTSCPGGESMLQVQGRIVAEMLRLRSMHPDQLIALVSHGDVIKAAVAHFLSVPLDLFKRIEIGLASVSTIALGDHGPWVLGVNHQGDEIGLP